ncbi:hypothetical protein SAMN05660199_01171 [Klenkia soli]|uniref:Uncharacterized protein n=2 Tax=Klenkia soli TaxID=1052260 RepID=A0A1H0G8J7_9ACTN|nr:hypothetical protein SAMN05660199_01171 [Klenkia soli]
MEDQIKAMTSHPETAFGDSSPALWRAGRREGLSSALQVFRRRLEESQRGDEPLDDQLTVDLLHRLVAEMTAAVMQADQPSLF